MSAFNCVRKVDGESIFGILKLRRCALATCVFSIWCWVVSRFIVESCSDVTNGKPTFSLDSTVLFLRTTVLFKLPNLEIPKICFDKHWCLPTSPGSLCVSTSDLVNRSELLRSSFSISPWCTISVVACRWSERRLVWQLCLRQGHPFRFLQSRSSQ